MSTPEKTQLNIGYIPLLDCVALLWAKHCGYFEQMGLEVQLIREASWASLRDRLAFGFLDGAHCLSALLPATTLGIDQCATTLQTPIVLSQNRAFITLKQALCYKLGISRDDSAQSCAEKIVQAYTRDDALNQNHNDPTQELNLAHVFKHSIHHYCLREWLSLVDQQFATSIQLQTLPPPFMADALKKKSIDGFCVGEPWNTQTEIEGSGYRLISSQNIIPNVADKVLAVTRDWAESNPSTLKALCTAIEKAQHDLKLLKNFDAVWSLLIEYNIIRFDCSPDLHVARYYEIQNIIQNFVQNSNVPNQQHFVWLINQMVKWDHLEIDQVNIESLSANCIITFE